MTIATEAPSPARPTQTVSVRKLLSSPLADYYLITFSVTILCGIGALMVLSASAALAQDAGRSPYYYEIKHLIFLAIGVVGALILSRTPTRLIRRLGWLAWMLGVGLLMLVMTGLGHHAGGNTNWLMLGPLSFQPSEFAKLALIVWAAAIFHRKRSTLHEPFQLLIPFVPLALLMLALVLAGRDLGTGIILGLIIASLMFFVGTPMRIMVPLGLVAAAAALLLAFGNSNRARRISIFLDPSSNTDLSSQPMSAVYAFASGGWWGRGLGAGMQKWGGLKNAAHTDFIFAVLGEELGLFGVLLVMGLFVLLGRCGLSVALQSDSMFNRLVAASLTAWFLMQAVINILVVLHLLPVLGVPLPFLSSGGSAIISCLLGVGILLSCARDTPQARRYLKLRRLEERPRMTSVMAVGR